jgi:ferritin-like metal-binding protein YciE
MCLFSAQPFACAARTRFAWAATAIEKSGFFLRRIATMSGMESLQDLLQDELKDIYDAEKQLTKALPKLAKKSSNEELRAAFEEHLEETQTHIERLERVFEEMDMPARGKKCEGMQHLIAEGNDMIAECEDDDTRDAVMIAAAQKCEHYEIASYGTVRTWASLLGKEQVAALLEETLEEEKAADQKLTNIAESFVNTAAAQGGDDEEEEVKRSSRRQRRDGARPGRTKAADTRRR